MAKPVSSKRPDRGFSSRSGEAKPRGERPAAAGKPSGRPSGKPAARPRTVPADPWVRAEDTLKAEPEARVKVIRRPPAGAARPAASPRPRNTGPWAPAARPKTGPRPAVKPAAARPKPVSASGLKTRSAAPAGERLQKILAAAGVASRRACEAIILEGRVQVNGVTVTELGSRADPRRDEITLDFQPIAKEAPVYILLNKPKGYVTSVKDDQGRPTVMALIHGVEARVYPVGRLDFNSEGLLLMTNDGALAQRLMAPEFHVAKVYLVKVHRTPEPGTLAEFREGFRLDGQRLKPCGIEVAEKGDNPWLKVTLIEGKNQQIRRMFAAVGHPVSKLKRIQFGPLDDPALKPGEWRFCNPQELAALKAL